MKTKIQPVLSQPEISPLECKVFTNLSRQISQLVQTPPVIKKLYLKTGTMLKKTQQVSALIVTKLTSLKNVSRDRRRPIIQKLMAKQDYAKGQR